MKSTKLVEKIFKNGKEFVIEHSPEILTGIGITGFLSSIGIAIKVTPKAYQKLENKKEELNCEKLPVTETVKTVAVDYLPVIFTATASTACVFGGMHKSLRRNAAIMTAYELLENNDKIYKQKVVEAIGEKKEKAIRDATAEESANNNAPKDTVNIYSPDEDGVRKVLFYEPLTGSLFWMNYEEMRKAVNDFYEERHGEPFGWITAYDFVKLLPYQVMRSLPDCKVQQLMDLGWNAEDQLNIEFSCHKWTDGKYKGYPYNSIDYSDMPRASYR